MTEPETTTEEKYACALRELKLRERNYPRWVHLGRMAQKEADRELRVMRAILADYAPPSLPL